MKTLISVAVMLVVVLCATFVWAQQQTAPAQPTKPVHPAKEAQVGKSPTLRGEIVMVDTTAKVITVKSKSGKADTLKIDPKAIVSKAGKTIALKDLSPKEKVNVSYKTEAGKEIATRIFVTVLPEKKEPVSKKKATATMPK
jgi:hypothetical protein